ncbi:MAG: hypothetical protein Fues2KO_39060 [Fuerstiella sp.]
MHSQEPKQTGRNSAGIMQATANSSQGSVTAFALPAADSSAVGQQTGAIGVLRQYQIERTCRSPSNSEPPVGLC